MYFTKIQGPRPARQGTRWVGEVIFNIFTFFHRVTRPRHPHIFNHPRQLIDLTLSDSTDNFIFPFSSPAPLVMNAFRFYVLPDLNNTSACNKPAKESTENKIGVNLIWFTKYLPDSGLKWTYWFFWLLHNVLMSWLCLQLHPSLPNSSLLLLHNSSAPLIEYYSLFTSDDGHARHKGTKQGNNNKIYQVHTYEWQLLVKIKFGERVKFPILGNLLWERCACNTSQCQLFSTVSSLK